MLKNGVNDIEDVDEIDVTIRIYDDADIDTSTMELIKLVVESMVRNSLGRRQIIADIEIEIIDQSRV